MFMSTSSCVPHPPLRPWGSPFISTLWLFSIFFLHVSIVSWSSPLPSSLSLHTGLPYHLPPPGHLTAIWAMRILSGDDHRRTQIVSLGSSMLLPGLWEGLLQSLVCDSCCWPAQRRRSQGKTHRPMQWEMLVSCLMPACVHPQSLFPHPSSHRHT